ncbi:hypothetical protein GGE65_007304 [Skermanella aerolata]
MCSSQIRIVNDDGQVISEHEILCFDKDNDRPEVIGPKIGAPPDL